MAAYCNTGFMLLSLALERHTKMPFEKILQENILIPLNLTSTFRKPHNSLGVTSHRFSDRRWDEGIKNAAGGLYSSSTALRKFLGSLINQGAGLGGVGMTCGRMDGWLNGCCRTGSPWSGYGIPLEVVYSNTLAPDEGVVPVITEGGALAGYFSTIILLPDYALAANILPFGVTGTNRHPRDTIISRLIPLAHSRAFSQATIKFTGTCSTLLSKSINTTITLTTAPTLLGLGVETFISTGMDMGAFVVSFYQDYAGLPTPRVVELRLLPTGIGRVWRMSVNFTPHEKEETVWSRACLTDNGAWAYAWENLSEFVFLEREGEIRVVGVELAAFRISLDKLKMEEKDEVRDKL